MDDVIGIGTWMPPDPGPVSVVSCEAPNVECVGRQECFARSVDMRILCRGKVEFRVPD